MDITDVRIKLTPDPSDRLLAFCSITIDRCFVVRDLKIIEGENGRFVAMPSRKLMVRCPGCQMKNTLRSRFCNQCGQELDPSQTPSPDRQAAQEGRDTKDGDGSLNGRMNGKRPKLYADIAHPISARCRRDLESCINQAYEAELELASQPGYTCRYEDYGEENYAQAAD